MAEVVLTPNRISGALQADLQSLVKLIGQADPMQLDCEGVKAHLDTLKPWLDALHNTQLSHAQARGAQVASQAVPKANGQDGHDVPINGAG